MRRGIHDCFVSLRCTLHMLERKCSNGIEKLKVIIGEHLQNGIPTSDILERTVSFFTLKKALLLHNGYSKCSREILRLFPTSEEDVASLCLWTMTREKNDSRHLRSCFSPLGVSSPVHIWTVIDLRDIDRIFIFVKHDRVMICCLCFSFICNSAEFTYFRNALYALLQAVVLLLPFSKKA